MGSLIQILIVGFVAGWLARYYMGARRQGVVVDIALGMVGAIAGDVVFGVLGFDAHGLLAKIVVAFIGAVIVIAVYRGVTSR